MVDGHDVDALCKAFHDASTVKGRPTCIVAKTFKGKGIPGRVKVCRFPKSESTQGISETRILTVMLIS